MIASYNYTISNFNIKLYTVSTPIVCTTPTCLHISARNYSLYRNRNSAKLFAYVVIENRVGKIREFFEKFE